MVDETAHAEGAEGDLDQVVAPDPFVVGQVEETDGLRRAAAVLEPNFGPQRHIATCRYQHKNLVSQPTKTPHSTQSLHHPHILRSTDYDVEAPDQILKVTHECSAKGMSVVRFWSRKRRRSFPLLRIENFEYSPR